MAEIEVRVPTGISRVACSNDGTVLLTINFEYKEQPADLTITMSQVKAKEVHAQIGKAIEQGAEWQKTGLHPTSQA